MSKQVSHLLVSLCPTFTNSGMGQRYTWYTQLIIVWISSNRPLFCSSKSFQEGQGHRSGWTWGIWIGRRWISLIMRISCALGWMRTDSTPVFFFWKLPRSNVTKDARIVDGRDCTTLFYVQRAHLKSTMGVFCCFVSIEADSAWKSIAHVDSWDNNEALGYTKYWNDWLKLRIYDVISSNGQGPVILSGAK